MHLFTGFHSIRIHQNGKLLFILDAYVECEFELKECGFEIELIKVSVNGVVVNGILNELFIDSLLSDEDFFELLRQASSSGTD